MPVFRLFGVQLCCCSKEGLCLTLLKGEVAWMWQAQEEIGSKQVEFGCNRIYFVLLDGFEEETKISLVSARLVYIVSTAFAFLNSLSLSLTHTQMLFGMNLPWCSAWYSRNQVHHNCSPHTTNSPVRLRFCGPPVAFIQSRPLF